MSNNNQVEDVQAEIQPGPGAQHVEATTDTKYDHEVILKSSLDDLSIWGTIKRFPKVSLRCRAFCNILTGIFKAVIVCQLCCIAAAADGYQINLNGKKSASFLK